MAWNVEKTNPAVHTFNIDLDRNADWEQWVLLRSDAHFDNPKTDNQLAHKHLRQAQKRNAIVCDFGDFFDAMQGKSDRRSNKGSLKNELKEDDYLGSMLESAVKYFDPYKDVIGLLGYGNHETGIIKHCEFDLTNALVNRLRDRGAKCELGGYRGWIRFMFRDKGGKMYQVLMHYTHGGGGGAEVTKGVIKTNRRAVYLPDANIVIGGHIHEAWVLEISRARITSKGREYMDEQIHICMPTYKDEFTEVTKGFHHEKERPPKPIGAQWLRFWWDRADERIKFECVRAK